MSGRLTLSGRCRAYGSALPLQQVRGCLGTRGWCLCLLAWVIERGVSDVAELILYASHMCRNHADLLDL